MNPMVRMYTAPWIAFRALVSAILVLLIHPLSGDGGASAILDATENGDVQVVNLARTRRGRGASTLLRRAREFP